jgi:peptidoglycan/LPS O-acetylase OafA/YrhL
MEPPESPTRREHAGATSPDSGYIPTLDGWRGVAILWVMIHHGRGNLFGPTGLIPSTALYAFARQGNTGVAIFFGISGFLICSRLLDQRRRTGRIDLADFYIRRSFRILPPYYAYLAVIGVLWAAGILAVGRLPYLSSLFFFRNYIPEQMPLEWSTGHLWSLAVEEHFYLLWPALLILSGTTRAARWTALGLALAVMVWREVDGRFHILTSWLHLPICDYDRRTDYRLDGLLLGCWMALVLVEPNWRERLTRWLSTGVWLVLLAVFAANLAGFLRPVMYQPATSILIPFLLVGTACRPRALPGRILEWGPLRWIGRLSYSLYLWQQLFLVGSSTARPLGFLKEFPLDWLACFPCALASYYLIERPAIAWGRRISALHLSRSAIVS